MLHASPVSTAGAARIADELQGGQWLHLLQDWGLKLLAAALIFIAGRWLARRLSAGLDRVMGRAGVDATLGGFLRNIAYAVMLVLVIMTALTAVGVPTTSMFAVLGAAGLAVGLALKDSLSNIASGVMLIVLRPFRRGDVVVLAGQDGTVLEIRVFQTHLRAADNRVVILPNSSITAAPIVNHSALPQRRIDVRVGVGYGDDLRLAREVLLGIARDQARVLSEPAPFVLVSGLDESSVTLNLFAFVRNEDYGETRSRILEAIRDRFRENGIDIPYPRRDLYVFRVGEDGGDAGNAPAATPGDGGAATR